MSLRTPYPASTSAGSPVPSTPYASSAVTPGSGIVVNGVKRLRTAVDEKFVSQAGSLSAQFTLLLGEDKVDKDALRRERTRLLNVLEERKSEVDYVTRRLRRERDLGRGVGQVTEDNVQLLAKSFGYDTYLDPTPDKRTLSFGGATMIIDIDFIPPHHTITRAELTMVTPNPLFPAPNPAGDKILLEALQERELGSFARNLGMLAKLDKVCTEGGCDAFEIVSKLHEGLKEKAGGESREGTVGKVGANENGLLGLGITYWSEKFGGRNWVLSIGVTAKSKPGPEVQEDAMETDTAAAAETNGLPTGIVYEARLLPPIRLSLPQLRTLEESGHEISTTSCPTSSSPSSRRRRLTLPGGEEGVWHEYNIKREENEWRLLDAVEFADVEGLERVVGVLREGAKMDNLLTTPTVDSVDEKASGEEAVMVEVMVSTDPLTYTISTSFATIEILASVPVSVQRILVGGADQSDEIKVRVKKVLEATEDLGILVEWVRPNIGTGGGVGMGVRETEGDGEREGKRRKITG
ncbi:hypothetical protein YB2330_005104 [Saitoella coloradoensis]